MKITVLLFAQLRELLGKEKIEIELQPQATARNTLDSLFDDKNQVKEISNHLLFAINQNYVQPNTILKDGDELALIPPVSGG